MRFTTLRFPTALSRLPLVLIFAGGCGAPPAPTTPTMATPSAATADADPVHRAAKVALDSLARRHVDVAQCLTTTPQITTEEALAYPPPPPEACAVLVARRPDKSWVVVVRPKPPSGQRPIQAQVTVSPGAEGVTHITYGNNGDQEPARK